MACFGEFCALVLVGAFVRKMMNFPPELLMWWTLKVYFWEVGPAVNTVSDGVGKLRFRICTVDKF